MLQESAPGQLQGRPSLQCSRVATGCRRFAARHHNSDLPLPPLVLFEHRVSIASAAQFSIPCQVVNFFEAREDLLSSHPAGLSHRDTEIHARHSMSL